MTRILDLPRLIEELPEATRQRARRLYDVSLAEGVSVVPPELEGWLTEQFGSVEAVRRQQIVRVTNRWSLEGALFSPLRGSRPHDSGRLELFARQVEATRGDAFCHPETGTPADPWGRVRGRRTITGANAARYDARHGLVIFDEHDPLAFDEESVVDMLEVGREWAERGHAEDPQASAYLLIWNGGPRAGGSIVHGHAQVLLGRGSHYPRIERLRRDAAGYRSATGGAFLDDIIAVHRDVGLAIAEANGVAILAALAPVKELEILIVGRPGMDERDPAFARAVARTVVAYRDTLGVRAFNLALQRPPIDPALAERDGWELIPPIVRLVDRGDPDSRSSDIGAMELYAAAVVGGDPFTLVERLQEGLRG
ncbi:MAG TPA: hypothetical protein VIA82_05545 [Candidatus Limnocylindria bacterium]